MASRAAAIVSPFSSGRLVAQELADRGWRTIAVLIEPLPNVQQKNLMPELFDKIIYHSSDVTSTVRRLAAENIQAVLSGDDTGIALTDVLARRMGLPGNDPATSMARRDKWVMAEALRAGRVACARSQQVTSLRAAMKWTDHNGFPVVLKPMDSAGSDGVVICDNDAELSEAFGKVHGAVNRMGSVNERLLMQEFLTGRQYFCDTVSRGGLHVVTEVWQSVRKLVGRGVVYDRSDLIAPGSESFDEVVSYTFKVLDAVGIAHGSAHTEVMLTESGPRLIETAARPDGMYCPSGVTAAVGRNQVGAIVDALSGDGLFANLGRAHYRVHNAAKQVFLIAGHDGVLTEDALRRIGALRTTHAMVGSLKPGRSVVRTVDLFTTPGMIFLVGPPEQVISDYGTIRALESSGLYGNE